MREMKEETRYRYEQTIKQLRDENERLREYRRVMRNVYDGITSVLSGNKEISIAWLLSQFRELFK